MFLTILRLSLGGFSETVASKNNDISAENDADNSYNKYIPTMIIYSLWLVYMFGNAFISNCVSINSKCKKRLRRGLYLKCGQYYISSMNVLFMFSYSMLSILHNIYNLLNKDANINLGISIAINMSLLMFPLIKILEYSEVFTTLEDVFKHSHILIGFFTITTIVLKMIIIFIENDPLFFIQMWNNNGSNLAGTIAGFISIITSILSVLTCYKHNKNRFVIIHKILSFLMITTSIWHYNITMYYLFFPTILLLIDIVIRLYNTHKCIYSKITLISDKYVYIEIILDKPIKYKPGTYFLICIKNISLLEWHPFTLINRHHNKYSFCAKIHKTNKWLNKLHDMNDFTDKKQSFQRLLYIQGPYNSLKTPLPLSTYKIIFIFCGGIGIASIFNLLAKIQLSNAVIYIHWILRDIELFKLFEPKLYKLCNDKTKLKIYITAEHLVGTKDDNLLYLTVEQPYFIQSNYRPNLTRILRNKIISIHHPKDEIGVIVFGPPSMYKEIKEECIKTNVDCNY